MAYFTVGSSWRAGMPAIGNTGLPNSILFPQPERATSYEVGAKATLNRHFRLSADIYQIDYKGQLTQFQNISYYNSATSAISVTTPAFLANVDARVRGFEASVGTTPLPGLSLDVNLSYSRIESAGGTVPCNDASRALTSANPMNFCKASKGAALNASPQFQGSVNGEYKRSFDDKQGYFRFVVNYQGTNVNFGNSDLPSKDYALVDLFAGVTGDHASWDFGVYAKNVFNNRILLSSRAVTSAAGADAYFGSSGYSVVKTTPPREVGVQFRYAFGSR